MLYPEYPEMHAQLPKPPVEARILMPVLDILGTLISWDLG